MPGRPGSDDVRLLLQLPRDVKAWLRERASVAGTNVTREINKAIMERIARESARERRVGAQRAR